jgi:hypothetical protein
MREPEPSGKWWEEKRGKGEREIERGSGKAADTGTLIHTSPLSLRKGVPQEQEGGDDGQ